jgi:hypothetical protein
VLYVFKHGLELLVGAARQSAGTQVDRALVRVSRSVELIAVQDDILRSLLDETTKVRVGILLLALPTFMFLPGFVNVYMAFLFLDRFRKVLS